LWLTTREDALSVERLTSRREFLKQGAAAGVAGTAFLSTDACTPSSEEGATASSGDVFRTLGRTGIRLPVVSMGTCYGITLVRAALDEGIVYLHTSSSYAERKHERLLGEATRDLPRDSFVIATSPELRYRYPKEGGRSLDLETSSDPATIVESLEKSLQRLGLEYVDIYYLASVGSREVTLHEPYLRAYERLKEDGKTRFVGIATHSNEPEVIRAAAESSFWDVVLTAYNFRQSHREQIGAAIDDAATAGLGIVAMKTQAGVYWDSNRLRKINMKAALKWVLQNENVHTTIPAFANFEEMREDMSIMENLALTTQEKRDLHLGDELGLSGLYCQQCGSCLGQCPAGVDVPTLMRSRMYALGHQDVGKARQTLQCRNGTDMACKHCETCSVRCSLGLDVRSGALELARLLEVSDELLA
jgi:predicted aldo/keto reductase-like oxidoreductase